MAWVYALGAAFFLLTGIVGYALTRDATYFAGWILIPGLVFGVLVELTYSADGQPAHADTHGLGR
jgi:hypothetical protein